MLKAEISWFLIYTYLSLYLSISKPLRIDLQMWKYSISHYVCPNNVFHCCHLHGKILYVWHRGWHETMVSRSFTISASICHSKWCNTWIFINIAVRISDLANRSCIAKFTRAPPPQLVSIPGLMNPVHGLSSHTLKTHFNIIIPYARRSTNWSLFLILSHQSLYPFLFAACSTHLILDYVFPLLTGIIIIFLILAHCVYKMWVKQEPNMLELWNKLHFEEKATEIIYHV